jgi:thiol-disulfide isomerase/thioredoxin
MSGQGSGLGHGQGGPPSSPPRAGGPATWLALAGAVALLAGATVWVLESGRRPPPPPEDQSAEATGGLPTPSGDQLAFRLPGLDGRERGPLDQRGKLVIVDFWATWCLPCHVQTDVLVKLYPEIQAAGGEVLAVAVGEGADVVGPYLAEKPVPYAVLLDPEDRVLGGRLGVAVLPVMLVLDRRGEVVHFDAGILDGPALRRILARHGTGAAG